MKLDVFFSLILGYLGVRYEMPCYLNDGLAAIPFLVVGRIGYKHLNYLRDNIYFLLFGVISFVLFCLKRTNRKSTDAFKS